MNVYIWESEGVIVVAKNEKKAVSLAMKRAPSGPPDHIIPCGPRESELVLVASIEYGDVGTLVPLDIP
jgi:hypothetical protein